MFRRIYADQNKNSKRRGHKKPKYTKQQLMDWCIKETEFIKIYINWCKSGFVKDLKPSIDRKENDKGYSFDNIRVTTWDDNRRLAIGEQSKQVLQICKASGNLIEKYDTLKLASQSTGIPRTTLSNWINNKYRNNSEYIFKFGK